VSKAVEAFPKAFKNSPDRRSRSNLSIDSIKCLIVMSYVPTTFGLSSCDTATEHNFTESPLIRLPAELREKIWGFCLSNIQICIRPSVKQDSDIRDYNYSWDEDRRLDIIPIPSTAGPDWTLTHRATYDCTSAVCQTWRQPSYQTFSALASM